MTGYSRQEAANIITGEIVQASHLNNEYNQLVAAFNNSSGHAHDGSTQEGAPITVLGPNQEITISNTSIYPTTTDVTNIGGPSNVFNEAYFGDLYVNNIFVGTSTATAIGLNDLTDVTLTSPVNNAILQYSTASSIWFDTGSPTFPGNVTIEGDLQVDGDTNIDGSLTVNNLTILGTAANINQAYTINTLTGTATTLALTDNFKYHRTTGTGAYAVTIPANASVAFPLGSHMHFAQAGAGVLTFTAASGVTINARDGDDGPAAQYVTVSIVKVATDEWDLVGALG